MKFGKRYRWEMVEEWREFYISYKAVKQQIDAAEADGTVVTADKLLEDLQEGVRRAEAHFLELMEELQHTKDKVVSLYAAPQTPMTSLKDSIASFQVGVTSPIKVASTTGRSYGSMESTSFAKAANASSSDRPDDEGTPLRHTSSGTTDRASNRFRQLKWLTVQGTAAASVMQGDKAEVAKRDYLVWFSTARELIRFAELNLECCEKAAKKVRKHWKVVGHEAIADGILQAGEQSKIAAKIDELRAMTEEVARDFQNKFGMPLEQFQNVEMTAAETWHAKWNFVGIAVLIFAIISVLPLPMFDKHTETPGAQKCLAMLIFLMFMWVTQAIPFFCTALLIPLIAVPLQLLRDPLNGHLLKSPAAAHLLMAAVFDYKQFLILGGLTIAKGLAKTHLELRVAKVLHRYTAHRPDMYMLGMMALSCFLCAFVSNHAVSILALSVVQPTLWELKRESGAPQALLLGLATACNLGGMLSPVASPQNAVAIQLKSLRDMTLVQWFIAAAPLVCITLVFMWWLILRIWKPFENVPSIPHQMLWYKTQETKKQGWTKDEVVVLGVTAVTVALWCLPKDLLFGDMGTVSLIPVVVFFGTGILKKEDFSSLPWHLIFLMAGGNMLSVACVHSGLLKVVSLGLKPQLEELEPYTLLVAVVVSIALVTICVKHTVAALIFLPFIEKAGQAVILGKHWEQHGGDHMANVLDPEMFVRDIPGMVSLRSLLFSAVLMISGSNVLPISSFPNLNSLLAEDETGTPYLNMKNFMAPGISITLFVLLNMVTYMVPYLELVGSWGKTTV